MENDEKYPNLNTPNAIKNRFQSGDDAVEKGRKGGKKSREKANIRKTMLNLLHNSANSQLASEILKATGMGNNKAKNQDALVCSIFLNALNGKQGYAELTLKIIGEMPSEKISIDNEKQEESLQSLVDAIKGVKYVKDENNTDKGNSE